MKEHWIQAMRDELMFCMLTKFNEMHVKLGAISAKPIISEVVSRQSKGSSSTRAPAQTSR